MDEPISIPLREARWCRYRVYIGFGDFLIPPRARAGGFFICFFHEENAWTLD
jgi:hypothetical protein